MSRFHPSVSWDQFSSTNSSPNQEYTDDSSSIGDGDDESWFSGAGGGSLADASLASVASPQSFFVPIHYEANYQYPLLVWLHNDGFNENQIDHVMPHVSTRNYLATGVRGTRAADSVGHQFDWHDSPAAIDAAHDKVLAAVDQACQRYSVHSSRIILAGYRSGGTMAMRIAMRNPDRFAAVASLGGRMPSGGKVLANLALLRKRGLPMLWQVATASSWFDRQALQSDIRAAMLLRAKVEIRQYSGDDEMNTAILSDFNHWIMNRIVAGNPPTAEQWQSNPVCFSSN